MVAGQTVKRDDDARSHLDAATQPAWHVGRLGWDKVRGTIVTTTSATRWPVRT